jgi:hypothetical protein
MTSVYFKPRPGEVGVLTHHPPHVSCELALSSLQTGLRATNYAV